MLFIGSTGSSPSSTGILMFRYARETLGDGRGRSDHAVR